MDQITLGNTDLQSALIVIGGNVFGWTLDERESFNMLDDMYEAGFNTIDTADVYSRWAAGNSGGESERIIGKWMKDRGNREDINIITKVGSDIGQGYTDLTGDHILSAVEGSLKRLQIDQIDLYLTHWDDARTPVEETLEAYQKLIEAGKVKYIGASNLSPNRLKRSLEASRMYDLPRYEVFQPGYNLYDRKDYEEGVASICMEENLGVITYYSLGKGFLSGKYQSEADLDQSERGSYVEEYLNERGDRILATLDEVAKKYGTNQAAVALAWLLQQSNVSAPIASATQKHHLQAFIEAVELELTEADIARLEEASSY